MLSSRLSGSLFSNRPVAAIAAIVLCAIVAVPITGLAGFRVAAALRETARAADLAPAGGRFVETRGGRIFVQEKGPREGDAVVLIHGTGAWSELWRTTMEHLAGEGFRAIALDIPPFGFSDRPATPSYGRQAQAERIADVLQGLGLRNAILVGHSFGAGPTVETVLRFPEQVRGLVLVAGALGLSSEPSTEHGRGGSPALVSWVMGRAWLRDALVAATATNPLATRYLLSLMVDRKERADHNAAAILQRPMTLANSTPDFGIWLEHFLLAPADGALSADTRRYADIKVATTLIWGDKDTITPLGQGQRLRQLIGGSRLLVMRDVGHIPHLEDPAAFNRHLVEALRTLGPAGK